MTVASRGTPGGFRTGAAALVILFVLSLSLGCGGHHRRPRSEISSRDRVREGVASWYGKDFDGKPTASGETFDMHAMTAAHRTLPLGTMLRVTNLDNGRSAVVKVNDRGPFIRGRDLDCSYGAAKELGYVNQGLARVRMEVVSAGKERPRYAPSAGEVLVGGPGSPGALLDGSFTVQVGAFVNPDNAVRLRDKLSKSFGDAYVIRFREFYRVRVGHAATEEDAESLRVRLAAAGLDGFVTVND